MQRDALIYSVLSAGTRPCADGCWELPLPIRGGRSLTGLCPAAAYERAGRPLPRDSPPSRAPLVHCAQWWVVTTMKRSPRPLTRASAQLAGTEPAARLRVTPGLPGEGKQEPLGEQPLLPEQEQGNASLSTGAPRPPRRVGKLGCLCRGGAGRMRAVLADRRGAPMLGETKLGSRGAAG